MNNGVSIKQRIFRNLSIDQIKLPPISGVEYWNVDKDKCETHVTKILLRCQLNEPNIEYCIGKDVSYKHEQCEVFAKIRNIKATDNYIEIEIFDFDYQ